MFNVSRLRSDKPNCAQLNNSVKCSERFPTCLITVSTSCAGQIVISNETKIKQDQDLYIQKFQKRGEAHLGLLLYNIL